MCLNADSEGAKQHGFVIADNINHSCALSSVIQSSSVDHNLRPHNDYTTTTTDVAGPSSRPRPARQSTGGRLMLIRQSTTPPRLGDDSGTDGRRPTETATKQPTRRASAPCNTSSIPSVSIKPRLHQIRVDGD